MFAISGEKPSIFFPRGKKKASYFLAYSILQYPYVYNTKQLNVISYCRACSEVFIVVQNTIEQRATITSTLLQDLSLIEKLVIFLGYCPFCVKRTLVHSVLLCFIKLKMIKKLNRGILLLFNFRAGNVWPWEHLPPLPLVHFSRSQVRFSISFTLSFSLRYHSVFPLFVCLTVEEREFTAHILLYIIAPLQSHPEFSTRPIIMFSHYCLSVLSFSHSSICTLWILCCMLTERRWERWLLNSCQTCRCDLDHPWGEEAVVNPTIMPWQLYKFCCNTDVKYSCDIWWDMTNNCDFS